MKNFVRSSLSVLLVLAMLLAIPAFAVGANDTDNINKDTNSSANILTEELYTEEIELTPSDTSALTDDVYEITSLRERNVKHIYTGDGKYTAIVYGSDVHRINENGELVDIDNRLTLKDDTYKTSDGRLSFDKSIASFNISENGYSIKMSLVSAAGAQRRAPAIANHAERLSPSKNLSRDEKINTLKSVDNKTEIVYNDVMSGTDIEYILNSNDIKENIIIKGEQDSYSYRFTLELEGLTPALNADGSISIYDSDIDVLVYTIPAPYMYDANGVYSYDAHYTLLGGTNGRYTLTVTANEDFVNAPDRAFPVTLDPTIVSQYSGYITEDTYISSANDNTNYGNAYELLIGNGKKALVKFSLPSLPSGAYIRSAYMSLPYHFDGESYGELYINAYRITDTWGESNATWSSINAKIDTTLLGSGYTYSEYTVTATSPAWTNVYITDAVNSWVSGASANYGIALSAGSGDREPVKILARDSGSNVMSVSVEYEFALADGVYAIKNIGNTSTYMSVSGSSTSTGAGMLGKKYSSDPVNSFSREALFKISRKSSTGTYIIRLMTNNSLSIAFSGTSVVTKEIPTNDASVSVSDTFYIEEYGNSFYIIPYSSTSYVIGSGTISGTSASLTKTAKSSATNTSRWTFTPYTGDASEQAIMTSSVSSLYCGDYYDFDAVVYSTTIGENGPVTYSVQETDGTNTFKASINSSTGSFWAFEPGTIKIGITYSGAPNTWWFNVTILVLPCSGYEIAYTPSMWNNSPALQYSNCYNYALNLPNVMNGSPICLLQPGRLVEQEYAEKQLVGFYEGTPWRYLQIKSGIEIQALSVADAAKLGITFTPIGKNEVCPAGTYKIALVIDTIDDPLQPNLLGMYPEENPEYYLEIPDTDYHWYRQNPDGTWSHKRGNTEVTNYDAVGDIIYDPQFCNRNYGNGIDYSTFVGYYAIGVLD